LGIIKFNLNHPPFALLLPNQSIAYDFENIHLVDMEKDGYPELYVLGNDVGPEVLDVNYLLFLFTRSSCFWRGSPGGVDMITAAGASTLCFLHLGSFQLFMLCQPVE
jgi:hypothetical protein